MLQIGLSRLCKAMVMYEDVVAANRAVMLLNTISRGIESGRLFCALWKFGFLADRSFLTIAARKAAAPDIVLIAACAHVELPPSIKDWINLWLSTRNGRPKALAAIVEGDESVGTARPPLFQLQEIARLGGIDFFSTRGSTEGGRHCPRRRFPARDKFLKDRAFCVRINTRCNTDLGRLLQSGARQISSTMRPAPGCRCGRRDY
jgi:hypothetical protein